MKSRCIGWFVSFLCNVFVIGNLFSVYSPPAGASQVPYAQELIEAHAVVVNSLIGTAERIKIDNVGQIPEAYRSSFHATLSALGAQEAEVYTLLNEDERLEVQAHLGTLGSTLEKISEFTKTIIGDVTPVTTDHSSMHAASGPKRAYVIGWLVCHRRCCANNVGNGVTACIGGPADCHHGSPIISESCPECAWCSWAPNIETPVENSRDEI